MKLIFIILLFCSAISYSQTGIIKGSVVDNLTDTPITGASVIIDGITFGDATDSSGNFIISNVPDGNYKIKATSIGYKEQSIQISFEQSKETFVKFSLSIDILSLSEIVI